MKIPPRLTGRFSACVMVAALLGGGCVGPHEDVARDAVLYPVAAAGVIGEILLQDQVYDSYGRSRRPSLDSSDFPQSVYPPVPESEFQSGLTQGLFPPPSNR